jgi:SAM-dependent methyltransferase
MNRETATPMEHKSPNYTITPRQASTQFYKNAVTAELAQGSEMSLEEIAKIRINHPEILTYKARILGGRTKTEHFADWTHFLVTDYGQRERCLSLGSGLGRVESYLVNVGLTSSFETIDLCAEVNEDLRIQDGRVTVQKGDLNFVELPHDTYDFILCHGVLHHLVNLEHVLGELNNALKPEGLLLVYEYVGETRWQFSEDRIRWLRTKFPGVRFKVPRRWQLPGFESVRSGDLLGLLQTQFGASTLRSVSYGGVYFPFVSTTPPDAGVHMKRVIALDDEVSKTQTLAPSYHMGLYRKSNARTLIARPWSDDEVRKNLAPETPLSVRGVRTFKRTPMGRALRVVKRWYEGRAN